MPKIRVLLADGNASFRRLLRELLARETQLEVVGEAKTGREAVRSAIQLAPDVVLMEVVIPDLGGIEATRRIRSSLSCVRIIALSLHDEAGFARAMLEAGASAYLLKDGDFETLVREICTADDDQVGCLA